MLLFEFSFHPNTHLQSFFSAFLGKNFRGCFTLFQTNNQYFLCFFSCLSVKLYVICIKEMIGS